MIFLKKKFDLSYHPDHFFMVLFSLFQGEKRKRRKLRVYQAMNLTNRVRWVTDHTEKGFLPSKSFIYHEKEKTKTKTRRKKKRRAKSRKSRRRRREGDRRNPLPSVRT